MPALTALLACCLCAQAADEHQDAAAPRGVESLSAPLREALGAEPAFEGAETVHEHHD